MRTHNHSQRHSGAMPFLICLLALFSSAAQAQNSDREALPLHLSQARQLVENLQNASENVYGGGKRHIDWDAGNCSARTVCSSFTTLLLQHTYGWTSADFEEWMHSTNPEADAYHDAIAERRGFERVLHITALRPGDFLAMKYTDHHISSNGVEDTGHVMLVADAPRPDASKGPIIPDTRQYRVTVIDSSASGHGPADTRARPGGKFTGGIGQGEIRLYANRSGRIVGYTWSTTSKSKYYCGPARDIVAGRLTRPMAGGGRDAIRN